MEQRQAAYDPDALTLRQLNKTPLQHVFIAKTQSLHAARLIGMNGLTIILTIGSDDTDALRSAFVSQQRNSWCYASAR